MSFFVIYSKVRAIQAQKNKKELEYDLESLDSIMREFREISDENNINITFVALRRTNTEDHLQFEIFKNVTEKYSFNFIDTAPEFKEDKKNYWIYRFDHHPNAEANKIFAEAIYKQIEL